PEAIDVREVEGEDSITIELRVDPDDMGKVIGKQGRIAKAIRTVVKAASAKSSKPVFVEII
ncbi:MAG: KH domain-containing protein, partial [Clostridia bacterium]|nr:KH domain-containing protein [Clostridia bacterium]